MQNSPEFFGWHLVGSIEVPRGLISLGIRRVGEQEVAAALLVASDYDKPYELPHVMCGGAPAEIEPVFRQMEALVENADDYKERIKEELGSRYLAQRFPLEIIRNDLGDFEALLGRLKAKKKRV